MLVGHISVESLIELVFMGLGLSRASTPSLAQVQRSSSYYLGANFTRIDLDGWKVLER